MTLWGKVSFGGTGLRTSRLAIGSSYGVDTADVERAFERGVNFFFWGSVRRPAFGRAVRNLAPRHRDEMVVAVESYARIGPFMRPFVESALRRLRIDHIDLLTLGWWNGTPFRSVLDAALALKERGKIRHIMISGHNRPAFADIVREPAVDAIMIRYNAAHPGAEREIFPQLSRRVGVLSFTATRWGSLLDPRLTPKTERTPRGADCYRFALTSPHVDAVMCGPKNGAELDEAMRALDLGPLDEDESAWMRRVGRVVREDATANRPMRLIDRLAGSLGI